MNKKWKAWAFLLFIGLTTQSMAQTNTFPNSGNVGIGTTSPNTILHLLSPNADAGLTIGADGKTEEIKLHIAGGNYGFLNLGGETKLRGNGRSSYFEGKLGVGTMNPTEKLTVNGKVKANEIIVTENIGADFVFGDNYDLPKLEEVESHIQKQNHLQGIPSAEKMKRNGVKVGNLQMKLLQKIEELTLYVIELKKENSALAKENELILEKLHQLESVSN